MIETMYSIIKELDLNADAALGMDAEGDTPPHRQQIQSGRQDLPGRMVRELL